MPVIWRDQMRVGNELIDQDHRYLICLFNSLELALDREDAFKLLPLFFAQLLDYTKSHFEREEKIQLKAKYPKYMEHRQEHQKIVAHLEEIHQRVQKRLEDRDPEGNLPIDADVLALAREWIIDHILKSDRDMIPVLKTLPKNYE